MSKYLPTGEFEYKDGVFGAGLVKGSLHSENEYFLKMKDWCMELRVDEVYTIMQILSTALWCKSMYKRNPKLKPKKWKELYQLCEMYKIGGKK